MIYSAAAWQQKKEKGLARFLIIDGILITGGPFAVLLQVVGYFFLAEPDQSFGQYFTDSMTWVRFILHGVLFGALMGFINWRRNERVHAS